ncbi:AAA family ATPase, partial [Vibrio parahaemolyticus]|nr:AAA family ATPase [Vibrio parahaemolyticus]
MDFKNTLLCWHSKRAGVEVLDEALKRLKNRKVYIGKVIVLTQSAEDNSLYREHEFGDIQISFRTVGLENPADHNEIYQVIESEIIPELKLEQHLHINVSPGTPAM